MDAIERKQRNRRKVWLKGLAAVISSLSAVTGVAYEAVLWGIDKRVEEIVARHEHPPSPAEEKRDARLFSLENDFQTQRKQLKELYRLKVGEKAAELEQDRRRRQVSAERARERFDYYVSEGDSLFQAYIKAAGGAQLP